MTQRRDMPQICTFDDLFRRYDLAQMKTAAFSAVEDTAAHAARQDNPHGVTKAQVGLGSVENLSFANYIPKADIINDLVTGGTNKVLSAEMGKLIAGSNYTKTVVYREGNDCNNNTEEWVLGGGSSAVNYPDNIKFWYISTIHYNISAKKQIAYEYQGNAMYVRHRDSAGTWSEWVYSNKGVFDSLDAKYLPVSGANANGSYIQFPDGTMICRHFLSMPANTDNYTWVFPAAFVSSPLHVFTTNNYSYRADILLTVGGMQLTSVNVYPRLSSNAGLVPAPIGCYIILLGRWKT